MMQLEQNGVVITIVLVVAFYLRLAIRQYNRAKHPANIPNKKKKGKKDANELPALPFFFGARVASWRWVIAACVLLAAGATTSTISNITTPFWWLPVDTGIIILWFVLK